MPARQRCQGSRPDPELRLGSGAQIFPLLAGGDAGTRFPREIGKARRRIPHIQDALIEIGITISLPAAERGPIAARRCQDHAIGAFERRQHEAGEAGGNDHDGRPRTTGVIDDLRQGVGRHDILADDQAVILAMRTEIDEAFVCWSKSQTVLIEGNLC